MNGLSLIDSILDGVYGSSDCGGRRIDCDFLPAVDIEKKDGAYVLYMDLPGKTEDDVEIFVKENVLTLASAVRAKEDGAKEAEEVQYLLRERTPAEAFKRTFTLAKDCDASNISARFKNGVLEVRIPLKKEAEAQKIRIQAA